LLNTQVQIQTSSNNISNAQNTSYSRQKAVVESTPAIDTAHGFIGTGASVTTVIQMRDQYLEQRLRNANSDESKYSSLSSQLTSVQAAAADNGSTGISQALGSFFTAWDTLSQDPAGAANQTGIYSAAQNLASTINTTYNNLNSIAADLPNQLQDTVDKANSLIDQIAEYNTAITRVETPGNTANSLRDARYQALSDLSQLIPVKYTEAADGTVTVTTTDASGPLTIVSAGTGTHIATTSTISGGQFGGIVQAQTDVANYIARLNTFTASLITEVNNLHKTTGTSTGPVVFTGADASSITASTTFLTGQSTSDENARAVALAGLQATPLTFADGKTATLSGYLSDIQKQMGTDAQQASAEQSFNHTLQTELQTQQQSVSGVSIDEEMVNLIQYQQVYQAAAKIVSTASQLLTTVINMVS
jgi:flagellar hook-associated protein 1 FlgK